MDIFGDIVFKIHDPILSLGCNPQPVKVPPIGCLDLRITLEPNIPHPLQKLWASSQYSQGQGASGWQRGIWESVALAGCRQRAAGAWAWGLWCQGPKGVHGWPRGYSYLRGLICFPLFNQFLQFLVLWSMIRLLLLENSNGLFFFSLVGFIVFEGEWLIKLLGTKNYYEENSTNDSSHN